MNIKENIFEGLRSIKSNKLRTVLTAAIITFGIMALVGILTAIDGMQGSVSKSFAGMGVNSFDIKVEENSGFRIKGRTKKKPKPISYKQAIAFKENVKGNNITIFTYAGQSERIKYKNTKTNPNQTIIGVDEPFARIKAYKIDKGRNITDSDGSYYNRVAVIGNETAEKVFNNENPIGKEFFIKNEKFTVVGVMVKKGGLTGGSEDRVVLIPLATARLFDQDGLFSYEITASLDADKTIEENIGLATQMMRLVRGDQPTEDDSFKIERSDEALQDLDEISGYLRIGGFGISFITLLGACIALMNIMMVTVTERTREIGIRKALGASPAKIRFQFLIEAIVICILGGLFGILLGLAMGNVVSTLIMGEASFVVPWNWIILGLTVCITVGLLSGFYPAYKASKLDPIESLRFE